MSKESLNTAFAALADPTRRRMVARLARGEATVGELGRPLRLTKATVSHHLRVLKQARLVRTRRESRFVHCSLDDRGLRMVGAWLDDYRAFWDASFDRLAKHVSGKR